MDGFKVDQAGDYIEKRPGSKLDYGLLWSNWLDGLVIASSTWDVPAPLVLESESHDDRSTVAVISGGAAGETFAVTNTITTDTGLIDSRSFRIVCVSP